MATSVNQVQDAFFTLYDSIFDRDFRKTIAMNKFGERELLPYARVFLLGWFGRVECEVPTNLPGTLTGTGNFDFMIGGTAVEFAVRRPEQGKASLSNITNATEIKKLVKHNGLSVLVLFDFSKNPFEKKDLERYREWQSLGKGNHKTSPFNVLYFHRSRDGGTSSTEVIRMNVSHNR